MQLALRQRLRDSEFLAASTVILAFTGLICASWHRWLSPLTDSGREMDLPFRLLSGELLYRDVNYLYGPFSPYFNALLYGIFGPSLNVLQSSGIIGSLLVILLSYRIARRLLEPSEAALAVLGVMVWLVFRPQGNLISPYAYAALHAAIFSLTGLLLSLRYRESERLTDLVLSGAMCGLAAASKLEFALPAFAATLLSVIFTRESGKIGKRIIIGIAPLVVMTLAVYGWFLYKVGWEILVVDCHVFYTHLPQSLVTYNAWRAGTNRPLASLLEMVGGFSVFVVAATFPVAAAGMFSWVRQRRDAGGRRSVLTSLALMVGASLTAVSISQITQHMDGGGWDGSPLRAAPLVLLLLIWFEWRKRHSTRVTPAVVMIAGFSLVMLLRVALRAPSGGPYGAFLLPTTYILFVYVLVRAIPDYIRARNASLPSSQSIAISLLTGVIVVGAIVTVIRYRTRFVHEVKAARGHFHVVSAHHPAIQEALDFLRQHSKADDRIAVFPEGSDIAFLSERRMPLRHQILLPGLVSDNEEVRMIEQLTTTPVRFVLVVNRSTAEFGPSVFGRDYYQSLGSTIEREYDLVKVCGRKTDPEIEIGDREFFIKILERK